MHFDGLGDVFCALGVEIVARKIEGRQRPDGRKYIRGRTEGYSCTYWHLGRNAAIKMAPEVPRYFPLKSASIIEASMVTGGASFQPLS